MAAQRVDLTVDQRAGHWGGCWAVERAALTVDGKVACLVDCLAAQKVCLTAALRAGHWGDYWVVEKADLTADVKVGSLVACWAVPRADHLDD